MRNGVINDNGDDYDNFAAAADDSELSIPVLWVEGP